MATKFKVGDRVFICPIRFRLSEGYPVTPRGVEIISAFYLESQSIRVNFLLNNGKDIRYNLGKGYIVSDENGYSE